MSYHALGTEFLSLGTAYVRVSGKYNDSARSRASTVNFANLLVKHRYTASFLDLTAVTTAGILQ